MRDLRRNRQAIHYSLLLGDTPFFNGDGYDTGETKQTWSPPEEAKVNRSPATGETAVQIFGVLPAYSLVLCTARPLPLVEGSRVWVDAPTDMAADYTVSRIANSINGLMFALDKVAMKNA